MKTLETTLAPAETTKAPIITRREINIIMDIHRTLANKLIFSRRIGCQIQLSKTNEMGLFIEIWHLDHGDNEPYRPIGISTKWHSFDNMRAKEAAIIDFFNCEREFPLPAEFDNL